jgi:hypothetical protein
MAKKVEIHHVEQSTKVAYDIAYKILQECHEQNVSFQEFRPVLVEAVIRACVPVAQEINVDPDEYIHSVGKALATCHLNNKTKGN